MRTGNYFPTERQAMLELFPIKLVGGFIAIDYHLGCAGCSFCLSRRHPLWRAVFDQGYHLDLFSFTLEIAISLLHGMKPFSKAKIPVRLSHNTDLAYQWDFCTGLYSLLPGDHPVIMLTRRPLTGPQTGFFHGQKNLLLKMTITPPSKLLGIDSPVAGLVDSAVRIHPDNLYLSIGPIVRDNLQSVAVILKRIPPGTWIDLKPLSVSGIPGMRETMLPMADELEALRTRAWEMGLIVTDFSVCKIRQHLSRPFYKARIALPDPEKICLACRNRNLCFQTEDVTETNIKVRRATEDIGLELGGLELQPDGVFRYECGIPASKGDETYLSEMTGYPIRLASTIQGAEGGCFSLEDAASHLRWQAARTMAWDKLEALVEPVWRRLQTELKPAICDNKIP